MSILYFETIDSTNRLIPSGDFEFGQGFGEGTGDRSYGIRIRTAGSGAHRTLRPRRLLPIQDDLQIQLQARIFSTIVSANDFEGVGLQVRAFRFDGINVNEVWRNQIETNPLLWYKEGASRWVYHTAVETIPASSGASFFVPEIVANGGSGFVDVSSFRVRSVYSLVTENINAGPDVRNYNFTTFDRIHHDLFTLPTTINRGQEVSISYEAEITNSNEIRFWYRPVARLRRLDGTEVFQYLQNAPQTPMEPDSRAISANHELIADEPYDQIRFSLFHIDNPNAGSLSISDQVIRVHRRDIVRTASG